MDSTVYDSISRWLNHVKTPQDALKGHSICPFASNIPLIVESISNIEEHISNKLTIFVDTTKSTSFKDLKEICDSLNTAYTDLVFLPDHYTNITKINSIVTNNQDYPLIIMQSKKELQAARDKLSKTDYYSFWDEEYLEEILGYGKSLSSISTTTV